MATSSVEREISGLYRVHVLSPQEWGVKPGTDFWLFPAAGGQLGSGNAHELADYGWTTTSLAMTAGSGADFLSADDKGIPNHILTDATGDLLGSPAVFGDYVHGWQAARLLNRGKGTTPTLPTLLVLEAWAAFSVASADENQSAFGFYEDGATISVANDQLAVIYSDGTNFILKNDTVSDTGAAIDNLWHLWRIVIDRVNALVYWYIDGTLQGSIAIKADEFPAKFGMHTLTTNRILLGTTHIYYGYGRR